MVIGRALCLLVASAAACGGSTTTHSTSAVDATAHDLAATTDALADSLPVDRPLPTCPDPHLALEVALENGTTFEECLPLTMLAWISQACSANAFEAHVTWPQGRNEVTTWTGWAESIVPGPFPFLREGEVRFGGGITLTDRRCNPPMGRCDLERPGDPCCDFDTRGVHSCRWRVLRAGRGGDLVEAELIAPCAYLERTYDGRMHTPPRTVTVMRARLRGVLQRVDPGVPFTHDGGFLPVDCGF